jgi:hypothetical protein
MGCRPLCVGCLLVSLPTGTRQGSRRHQAGRRGRPPPSKKRRGSHRHQAGRRGSSGRALRLSPVRSKLRRRRPSTPSKSRPPSRETPLPLSWTSAAADSRREAAPREVGGLVLQAADAGGHGGDLVERYAMMSSWPTGPPPGPYGGRRSRLGRAAFKQGLHRRSPAARLAPFHLNRYLSPALGWVVALNQVVFFTINFRLFCIPLRCKQRLVPFFFDSLFLYLFFRSI